MRRSAWLALLFGCSSCLLYASALHAPFLFDDYPAIVDNPQVRTLWPLSEAMTPAPDLPTSNRPLVALSFSINYALGGLGVTGYHATNIALHASCALLLCGLLLSLLAHEQLPDRVRRAALPLSAAISWLWCVHPLLSESVVYVTQRTELMAAAFCLLAMLCAVRSFRARRALVWQWSACVAALLAIGSKETAATLSIAILCLDRLAYSPSLLAALRRSRVLYAGLLVQFLIAAIMSVAAPYEHAGIGFSDGVSALQWLGTQAAVIVLYLQRVLWPSTLSISYHFPIAQRLLHYWPALSLVSTLFVGTIWLAARRPLWAFPGLWFFIYLAPSSSFVPMPVEVVAERRMYLPAAAIISYVVLLAHWVLWRAQISPNARKLCAVVATLALGCALSARTLRRLDDYTSHERIWAAAVAADPTDPRARLWLALQARASGDLSRARSLATTLLDRKPEYPGEIDWPARAQVALGSIEEDASNLTSALVHYDAVGPDSPEFHIALVDGARILLRLQRAAEAVQRLRRAIELGHAGVLEHQNLGVALSMLGEHAAASEQFALAYELDPRRSESLKALGTSLFLQGELEQSAVVLQEIVRRWPDDTAAHHKLGQILTALGRPQP
jgi:tetratricopeptide (TPR) repeat protein